MLLDQKGLNGGATNVANVWHDPMYKGRWRCPNVKGIDKLNPDGRGGYLKQKLSQLEARWIMKVDTLQPKGLNEVIGFAPFL